MIHLVSVAKNFHLHDGGTKLVLLPTTMDLPSDRPIAILGSKQQGKSVFLRLLSGVETPTQGAVMSDARFSPVIRNGVLFRRKLSLIENIRFVARIMNFNPDELATAVDEFCRSGDAPARSAHGESDEHRKAAELALFSLLAFDCYLVDEIWLLPEVPRRQLFDAAAERNAGVIFATSLSRLAREHAASGAVVRDHTVHYFPDIEEAIEFHER